MERVCLLGATGSIGSSTLQVLRRNRDRYHLSSVCAQKNYRALYDIIREFKVEQAALADKDAALALERLLKDEGSKGGKSAAIDCKVLAGEEGVCALAAMEHDFTVASIVGAAGLKPSLAALKSGARLGLANKEALVMSGQLFFATAKAHQATVLPIDSEHSAIFQCLPDSCAATIGRCDLKAAGVHKILLTGSGGPFRNLPVEQLAQVRPEQALRHPTWSMGPKITIDSATMMNKGLEFIEARFLFNAGAADIEILIHPQSVVHSMVSYRDGAVLAQLGMPDMKTPIARALAYPGRIDADVQPLDFTKLSELSFLSPDFKRYPCLKLAIEASRAGQGECVILNAVNECAVQAFLAGALGYTEIARICEQVLWQGVPADFDASSLDSILALDAASRIKGASLIKELCPNATGAVS